ncbi:hypothetical protein KI387_021921, partial [Taxus chinensis]
GTKNINACSSRQGKLVSRDISRGSRQKSVLENAHRTAALLSGYRTAALFKAAVKRLPPCRVAVSSLK